MTTNATRDRDRFIHQDVLLELTWAPQVREAQIGVSVLDGVVTLSGEVASLPERMAAERVVKGVTGVSVVADDLTVRHHDHSPRTDTDLGAAVKHVLEWSANLPANSIRAEVRHRVRTLTGAVPWNYQREGAERLVHSLTGVLRVDNQLTLTPRTSATDTKDLIRSALVRHALQDADAVTVTTEGSEVTLTGRVGTWAEKSDAGHAAWASPHTSAVHNRIVVGG